MNQQEAIKKLQGQQNLIAKLRQLRYGSQEFKQWRRDTKVILNKIFSNNDNHANEFSSIDYSPRALSLTGDNEHRFQSNYLAGLESAEAMLKSMIKEIKEWGLEEDVKSAFDAIATIEHICEKFHRIVRQIKSRHDNRNTLVVEDEYDVQDLLHALLTLHFDDIRAEEWVPSYAGGCSRMDFLLKQEQIVVEVKKTGKNLAAKEIGEQLIVDISKYKIHPDCQRLFCFVYDPEGRIANPSGIENDLNKADGDLPVRVLITPK